MHEILLVDCDSERLDHLSALLTDEGFKVQAAGSLDRARELCAAGRGDLLVSRLLMPEGPTFDLTSEWTAAGRPALVLTDVFYGATNRKLLTNSLRLLDVLELPLDDDDLIEQLKRLLQSAYPSADQAAPRVDGEQSAGVPVPKTLDPSNIPSRGGLLENDIASVLAGLALSGANGGLMLQVGDKKKLIYFADGAPVGIKSTVLHEYLGQMLVREGLLAPEQCEHSLLEMRRTQRAQGQVLIEMGLLTPNQLHDALARQFRMKLQEILGWDDGAFKYKDCTIPKLYNRPPLDDPAQLIWEAICEARPLERAARRLTGVLDRPAQWGGIGLNLENLRLPESLAPVFDRLDGRGPAGGVIGGASDPELALLLLYALTAFGALTYQSSTPEAPAASPQAAKRVEPAKGG